MTLCVPDWAPDMLRRQTDGRRRKYDERVDWFSLGCFVYEMIVGVCPFRTERAATWPITDDDEKDIQKQVCLNCAKRAEVIV